MNTSRLGFLLCAFFALAGCDSASSKPAAAPPTNPTVAPQAANQDKTDAPTKKVTLLRTPDRGIQPQAVMDKDVLHLIYFKGEPKAGDVFYVKSHDGGQAFSKPLRVNSQPGSVIAAGNVRGAHLAIGAGGRAHVAWMGSMKAAPKGDHHAAPMLYARLNDAGDAFEPQRNLIQTAFGLDGGGSVAADGKGVYVAWHAPAPGAKGEENRRVWLTTSTDEGKSFGQETAISPAFTGSCGCCGMRVASAAGQPLVMYRGAQDVVHRAMYLLTRDPGKDAFTHVKLQDWDTGVCPMSTMSFAAGTAGTIAAWETEGQIHFTHLKNGVNAPTSIAEAPGKAGRRRHPAVATNGREVLLAWTEGMGWNKGGSLAWQVFDAGNQPQMNAKGGDYGRADGVPVWSVITAVALPDGRFVITY